MFEANLTQEQLYKIFAIIRAIALLGDEDSAMPNGLQYGIDELHIMLQYLLKGVQDKEGDFDIDSAYEEFVERDIAGYDQFAETCDEDAYTILYNIERWQKEFDKNILNNNK